MATTWLPRRQDLRTFILEDGSVVDAPRLEQTSTGRKIRVADAPSTSWFSSVHEASLQNVIEATARSMGTRYWMTTPPDIAVDPPKVFQPGEVTVAEAWWRFRHATLPIEAVVEISLSKRGPFQFQVTSKVRFPDTRPKTWAPNRWIAEDEHFGVIYQRLPGGGIDRGFRDWEARNRAEWTQGTLGPETFSTERLAVNEMRRRVNRMEDLDSITIPDLRKLNEGKSDSEFAWLDLQIVQSSVSGAFVSDMNEYLAEGGNVERTRAIYLELVESFRSLGMVMDGSLSESTFMRALLSGDTKALTVRIGLGIDDDGSDDHKHAVSLHLPTGTIVVDCRHTAAKPNEVAQAWEESLFLAQMTGKKDVLLAYAEEYVETKHEKRTSQIVSERIDNQRIN